jgi:glycosyltransferase involved in cell wall biosynthesis
MTRREGTGTAPSVSVVIPTHDRRDLAMHAIRSVLRQRDVDLEVIVVDDGSRDGTGDVVRSLSDPAVRVLRHNRPFGVATARNKGIEAARGEWIALLDDDDLWAPDKVKAQLEAARDAGRDWVYAGAVEIDEGGRYLGGDPPPSPDTLINVLTKRNLMPAGCSNVMVKSELMSRAGGFEPTLRHLADWDLWLRLARYGPPAYVPEPLVAYRVHDAQASMDTSDMLEEALALYTRNGADRVSVLRWFAWSCLRQGRRWDAVRAYGQAVRAGDLLSIGRALVAVAAPRTTTLRRRRATAESAGWRRRAQEWLPSVAS